MKKMDKDTRDSIIAGLLLGVLYCLAILAISYFWGDELVSGMVESLTRF